MVHYIDQKTIPCEWCGAPTRMFGTKKCDGCWELYRRIESQPELAQKMLAKILEEDRPR